MKKILIATTLLMGFSSYAYDKTCGTTIEPGPEVKKYTYVLPKERYSIDAWRLDCRYGIQILYKARVKANEISAVTSSSYDYVNYFSNGKYVAHELIFKPGISLSRAQSKFHLSTLSFSDPDNLFTRETPITGYLSWDYSESPIGVPIDFDANTSAGSGGSGGSTTTNSGNNYSGLWYDRNLAGLGFNLIDANNGLTVYFYGYDAAGAPLWLVSTNPQSNTPIGKTLVFEMYEPTDGNGGNFNTKPVTPSSGTNAWGTLSINFSNCNAATAVLRGKDGEQGYRLTRLAINRGSVCNN